MPPDNNPPLTRGRILATAEDVIRRFGPDKATVVDVARVLGVSHAAVYRHVATKAELRRLVVGRWVEATMAPLRAVAEQTSPAPRRLRRLFDTLIAVKRRRAANDPELFAAYRTLAADAQSVVAAHVEELVALAAEVIRSGVKEGTFRAINPMTAGRAVLHATSRFHHPAHAAEWSDPAIDAEYNEVWRLLMDGLRVGKPNQKNPSPPGLPSRLVRHIFNDRGSPLRAVEGWCIRQDLNLQHSDPKSENDLLRRFGFFGYRYKTSVNIGDFAFSRLLWLTVICFKNGKQYQMSVSNLQRDNQNFAAGEGCASR
jgi:AcrR family transcriptional regulator